MSLRKDSKITLGMLKGKPVTTSVPSISIKFHANVEEIEEVRFSDEETPISEEKNQFGVLQSVSSSSDQDSRALKLFPKLVKRSTSVDVSTNQSLSSSPPNDPWRFFSDIKGKITKSVEEKITEIKARHEEGSPLHKAKTDSKQIKEGNKDSSSFSDSEDQSESSISKTCGFASTTEGVEMSSDDETSSIDKDKKMHSPSIRQKFRFLKHHSHKTSSKEGTINVSHLSKLYNINTEKVEQALPEHTEDIESAVDALEETDFRKDSSDKTENREMMKEEIVKKVVQKIDNINLDSEKIVNVEQVSGEEIRKSFLKGDSKMFTVFAPTGFVDLRFAPRTSPNDTNVLPYILLSIYIVVYAIFHSYLPYLAGALLGASLVLILGFIYVKLYTIPVSVPDNIAGITSKIMEIPAVKEYQPVTKFEGWVNEFPEAYDPVVYHISRTQSVFLRLQGNLLRISHSKGKVPKRAMWNEHDIRATFSHHRIYNLLGAKIGLLPEGLAKIRLWSKKYPICITLNKDQLNFDPTNIKMEGLEEEVLEEKPNEKSKSPKAKKKFTFRKKDYSYMAQRFSKLAEDQDIDLDSDSRASTPSPEGPEVTALNKENLPSADSGMVKDQEEEDEMHSLPDDSSEGSQNVSTTLFKSPNKSLPHTNKHQSTHTLVNKKKEGSTEVKIYIFGRTDREKEDWFRRLAAATHHAGDPASDEEKDVDRVKLQLEYTKYMMLFNKVLKAEKTEKDTDTREKFEDQEMCPKPELQLWFNSLIGRVLFDCIGDPGFMKKVQNRIQKKLQTIKLPYFIEEILITELSLGKTPPFLLNSNKPQMDDRGLWVDLDVSYEGSVVLTLQTKLNLMRLKNPQSNSANSTTEVKSAIYHSDVDDTAESSSDEDGPQEITPIKDGTSPADRLSAHGSKKFIKMVDRLTESKLFQAATDNRYIKKAMEGVSNTELRLTVELKALSGTVVLNIPPPPNDRIWVGFRPVPELVLTACPIVGERNVNYTMVTKWIEKKMLQEFEKVMVIPNMEDFLVPVMNSNLPE
ncbi:testis-expressed protein 2 isoform X2 [Euwallacea similis]|uniref:testis-expressed protein 2 isoform X2 n=1 Tax=Euwallacea similis TaxID=1736056 RepID=UPI00344DA1BA